MNPMLDAIRKKRMGGAPEAHSEKPGLMQDGGGEEGGHVEGGDQDLHSIVQGLSAEEKSQLMQLLQKDQGDQSMAIEKGAPSSDEKAQIAQNMATQDDDSSGQDSDDIAMSMLDSRDKGQNPMEKPRNLGERMRMHLTSKLKGKGKL